MTKQKIKCSHCIVGSSYSAMIASHILSEQGINTVVVQTTSRPTHELEIANMGICPLPIFPVRNSDLYRNLKLNEFTNETILNIEYSDSVSYSGKSLNYKSNSLADFLCNNSQLNKWIPISLKRWGKTILTESYSEVQNKIRNHYLSEMRSERVGFLNGHSVYYQLIKKNMKNVISVNSIIEIDYQNKTLNTDLYSIQFEKLISTIPINRLFEKSKIPFETELKYEGSYFNYFSHGENWKQNNLIYDCDLNTDIIRVFSPTNNIISVQLPTFKRGKISIENLKQDIKKLIPSLNNIKYEGEFFLSMSYPLESIINLNDLKNIEILKSYSVQPFGRFGNWEYLDLHELNWDNIN
jgi:hypothetical protein